VAVSGIFREKDFQQLALVRRWSRTSISMSRSSGAQRCVSLMSCVLEPQPPTGPDDRSAATVLFKALEAGVTRCQQGAAECEVEATMVGVVAAERRAELDYAVVVIQSPRSPASLSGELRLLIAARVGPVRLIDNLG